MEGNSESNHKRNDDAAQKIVYGDLEMSNRFVGSIRCFL
jgi:hypothetical protein